MRDFYGGFIFQAQPILKQVSSSSPRWSMAVGLRMPHFYPRLGFTSDPLPSRNYSGAHREPPHQNERHSFYLENSRRLGSFLSGTRNKNWISGQKMPLLFLSLRKYEGFQSSVVETGSRDQYIFFLLFHSQTLYLTSEQIMMVQSPWIQTFLGICLGASWYWTVL